MADVRLASALQERAVAQDWDAEVAALLPNALASSTLAGYDGALRRLQAFLASRDTPLFSPSTGTPTLSPADLAAFLEYDTRSSEAPRSRIKQTSAAVTALFRGHENSPSRDALIALLKDALVKQRTSRPTKHSVPLQFTLVLQMFRRWGPNSELEPGQLRAKAVSLLAYALAMRPSDASNPRRDSLRLSDNGTCLHMALLGDKTDHTRQGKTAQVHAASDPLVCPVATLAAYIEATPNAPDNGPLFVALTDGAAPLAAKTLANIMKRTALQAGAPADTTARSYRSGSATTAMEAGVDIDTAMRAGRWRTVEVFREHYVHRALPGNYTDIIFGLSEPSPSSSSSPSPPSSDVDSDSDNDNDNDNDNDSVASGPTGLRRSATRGVG